MTYASSNRFTGMNEPTAGRTGPDFDAFVVDPDFDDTLDAAIASLRETLSDSRYF